MKNPKIDIYLEHIDGNVKKYKVKEADTLDLGTHLKYKYGGLDRACEMPKGYKLHYYNGRAMVAQKEGSSLPVPMFGDLVPSPGDEYGGLLRQALVYKANQAIHGDKPFPMKAVLIGIIIVAVIVAGIMFYKSQQKPETNGQVQQGTVKTEQIK